MIFFSLQAKVPRNRRKEFIDSARLIVEPTKIQPGCINCRLYEALDEPDTVLLAEAWESRQDLDRHINSDLFRIVLSLIDASAQFPDIQINTISKTEGLEAIETVRSG